MILHVTLNLTFNTIRRRKKSSQEIDCINTFQFVSSYLVNKYHSFGQKMLIYNIGTLLLYLILTLCRWYKPRCLAHSTMDVTLFVLMTIACICGSYKGLVNFPPPLHGNLAKTVDNYAFASYPTLSGDNRTYEIRFTGTSIRSYKYKKMKPVRIVTFHIHISQVRNTICMMLERKGVPQVLDYLIPPSAKKHALS